MNDQVLKQINKVMDDPSLKNGLTAENLYARWNFACGVVKQRFLDEGLKESAKEVDKWREVPPALPKDNVNHT